MAIPNSPLPPPLRSQLTPLEFLTSYFPTSESYHKWQSQFIGLLVYMKDIGPSVRPMTEQHLSTLRHDCRFDELAEALVTDMMLIGDHEFKQVPETPPSGGGGIGIDEIDLFCDETMDEEMKSSSSSTTKRSSTPAPPSSPNLPSFLSLPFMPLTDELLNPF